MKKILIAFFALISLQSYAQRWETIKGNGNVKTETRTLSGFTSLSSQGPMNVQIAYGNSNELKLEADGNLLPFIETFVEDGKLVIRTKKDVNLTSFSKMIVYVSMVKINSLQQSGSGNINGEGVFVNDGRTEINVSGSGNVKLRVDSFSQLGLNVSGSGNIDLKGNKANSITANVSGSGKINCSQISANDVIAKISGSGNIKVFVLNSLYAKISGSGNVFYKGDPASKMSKIGGSGKVIKI